MSGFKDECGVIGIWNHEDASRLAYLGLYAMQHRGQESAGIVSYDHKTLLQHKGLGLVGDVFSESTLNYLKGNVAIGHVRYSTTGQNLLANAQPLTAELYNNFISVAHNGNIVNASLIRKNLQKSGAIFQGSNDTECVLHLMSKDQNSDFVRSLQENLSQLEGAFSFVILNSEAMYAVRDNYGFRPLVLGEKKNDAGDTSYVVASETCAFDLIGAKFIREIKPGEICKISKAGVETFPLSSEKKVLAQCVFEHVYFSRPDSIVYGKSVYETRKNFGKWLATENQVEADVVIPVPDSGLPSAIGFSNQSKIPFELGIIRNQYVGRTFIQPVQTIRSFGVKIKLNPQQAIIKDKRVIIVDDSLVRGTTSKKIIALVRQAGAKEVHLRIASPPTIGPCFYGVDTPQKSHLIAAQHNIDEIRNFIEADSLSYLSLDGMFASLNETYSTQKSYCAACFDGKYPTPLFE